MSLSKYWISPLAIVSQILLNVVHEQSRIPYFSVTVSSLHPLRHDHFLSSNIKHICILIYLRFPFTHTHNSFVISLAPSIINKTRRSRTSSSYCTFPLPPSSSQCERFDAGRRYTSPLALQASGMKPYPPYLSPFLHANPEIQSRKHVDTLQIIAAFLPLSVRLCFMSL